MIEEVTVLIPIAGQGSHFRDVGFIQSKPMIDVGGRPMISWVVDNILPKATGLRPRFRFVVVVRRDEEKTPHIVEQLHEMVPNIEVVYAEGLTEGAACTCLLAREHIDSSSPLLVMNSDQYVEWNEEQDSTAFWRQVSEEAALGYDGNILCFKQPMELGDDKWSYAVTDSDGFVTNVREKDVISDNATVGAYFWHRGADFVSAVDEMIARNARVQGQFYVAPAYNICVERGQRIRLSFCRRLWGLREPGDLVRFLSGHLRLRSMHTLARHIGCELSDLSHLRPLLPAACRASLTMATIRRDDSRGTLVGEETPHRSDTGETIDGFDAAQRSPAATSTPRGDDDRADDASELKAAMRNLARVKFIARENEPGAIERAISDRFEVQVNVWYRRSSQATASHNMQPPHYFLGDTGPQYQVSRTFLETHAASLWLQCQDASTLAHFAHMEGLQCFLRPEAANTVVLTSCKSLWASGAQVQEVLRQAPTVAVFSDDDSLQPQYVQNGIDRSRGQAELVLGQPLLGICARNVRALRMQRDRMLLAAHVLLCSPELSPSVTGPTYQRIQLIIFDLDGVLVESQQLHFRAMNEALAAVAGTEFVISAEEHGVMYDGLSTQQKLNLLTSLKGLSEHLHSAIWLKKQEITRQLVEEQIPHDADVVAALAAVKRAGFPVAVASNCIHDSVVALLQAVGVLHLVDAIYSNESVRQCKPAGDMYELVARSFGAIDPKNIAVFEDSHKGFEAVVRAKCNLFRVSSPRDIRAHEILRRILAFEVCSLMEPLVNVLVPMGGTHPSFWTQGPDRGHSEMPVVLSNVRGKPALFWNMLSLQPLPKRVHFIFVVSRSLGMGQGLCALTRILPWAVCYARTTIIVLDKHTRGAVQSALQACAFIDNDSPLAVFDGHHRISWPSSCRGLARVMSSLLQSLPPHPLDRAMEVLTSPSLARVPSTQILPSSFSGDDDEGVDAVVTVFRDCDFHESYVKFAPGSQTRVVAVQEKMPLSDMACSGLYCFKRGCDFVRAALSKHALRPQMQEDRVTSNVAAVLDALISMDKRVHAVVLPDSSSVRSFAELKRFTAGIFSELGPSEQKVIYDDMRERNSNLIADMGFTHDTELSAHVDTRVCLASYVLASNSNFVPLPRFDEMMDELRARFPQHVVYQPMSRHTHQHPLCGGLHWTFMQIVGFNMFGKVSLPEDYMEIFETLLQQYLMQFKICFDSLIVTPSNLVMVGHPTADINYVRECIRVRMRQIGYPLLEPYEADTLHMTLVRFAQPLTADQEAFLRGLLDRPSAQDSLALLCVDHLSVSAATWKMLPSELGRRDIINISLQLPN